MIIGNGQFADGGLRLSPRSFPGDGVLDAQSGRDPSRQRDDMERDGQAVDQPFAARVFKTIGADPITVDLSAANKDEWIGNVATEVQRSFPAVQLARLRHEVRGKRDA